MRSVVHALAALATAVLLVLAVPASAEAAFGTLVINGQEHVDPSGCYNSERRPLTVGNYTNELALVYDSYDCTGVIVRVVAQNEEVTDEFGMSVYIR